MQCCILQGLNQTDIHWSVVEDNSPDQFNIHGKNLLFMRATKEIEGKFECNAINEMGSDQKSFIIKVTRKKTTHCIFILFLMS